MKELVTVLTPTYNRKKEINNLYKSLMEQTDNRFIWLVIDDGSTDNTENLILEFQKNAKFEIVYIKKCNGGKHTALNLGFSLVKTELTIIVDSDDVLTPDAIEQICNKADYIRKHNLAGVAFLRGYNESKCIGDKFPDDNAIMNDIDVRLKKGVSGDKSEVWKSDILRKYQFPVFEGEKFQGENYVWWQIAREYNMLYVNKIIYITEYLEGGLTKSGRKLRIQNPLGGMENSKMAFYPEFPLKTRVKCGLLYCAYGFFAKKKIRNLIEESGSPIMILGLVPFGKLLHLYWYKKYEK